MVPQSTNKSHLFFLPNSFRIRYILRVTWSNKEQNTFLMFSLKKKYAIACIFLFITIFSPSLLLQVEAVKAFKVQWKSGLRSLKSRKKECAWKSIFCPQLLHFFSWYYYFLSATGTFRGFGFAVTCCVSTQAEENTLLLVSKGLDSANSSKHSWFLR